MKSRSDDIEPARRDRAPPWHVMICIGTRPEVIKMAPVIKALQQSKEFATTVVFTGQHEELAEETAAALQIAPDVRLHIPRKDGTLEELTALLLKSLSELLHNSRPDIVLAQGDTTTVMCAALASFYAGIDFAHVEAGLRTYNLQEPFPEEANRQMAARLAAISGRSDMGGP